MGALDFCLVMTVFVAGVSGLLDDKTDEPSPSDPVRLKRSRNYRAEIKSTASDGCSDSAQNSCLQELMDFRDQLGITEDLQNFPDASLDDKNFKKYCQLSVPAFRCLYHLHGCDESMAILYKGTYNAYDYACRKIPHEYQKHRKCYAKSEVQYGAQRCTDEMNEKMNSLISIGVTPAKWCRYVEPSMDCLREAIGPACGEEAAEIQVNIFKKALEFAVYNMGCDAWKWHVTQIDEIENDPMSTNWLDDLLIDEAQQEQEEDWMYDLS